jgi:hypothetical protein
MSKAALLAIITAHTAAAVAAERERAVAWLRDDAQLCDCAAHSDSECACGAWDDWKTVAMPTLIARFIEATPHKP